MEPTMSGVTPDFIPSESCPLPEWFAIYVMPRHEKRIAVHLRVRQIECFLPLYQARHKWKDGSKVTVQLPLFPNYLFVRTLRSQRGRALEVPGVLSAVGKRESSVISETYIDSLRRAVSSGNVEPHPYLATGTMVRVRSGVLAGLQGIVLRQKAGCRVVLSLELIMKSVAIEVDIADLE
jgi:transcription antitermination factor NusG